MPITDTQQKILTAAAQHPDGVAVPPPSLPPAPRAAVAKAMLASGLLLPATGAADRHDPSHHWKLDGTLTVLRLTELGRRASETAAAEGDSGNANALKQAPKAPGTAPIRLGLRGAARAVLAAWTSADRGSLPDAIDCLQQALAKPATPGTSKVPRAPRHDTKQAIVLALLRRPEGASGPQLIEVTGWAPHTVRGFLAGLGRKGIAITVLERVRQVGPNKAGAKGSYSIYRIGEAG